MRSAVPSASSRPPQTNVTRSPGLSSTMSPSSGPMRSFGPGEVLQDRHGPAGAAGRVAHEARGVGVLLVRAVAEVQPGDVHPRRDHPHEDLRVVGRRADGGDDLRAALHSPEHTVAPPRA